MIPQNPPLPDHDRRRRRRAGKDAKGEGSEFSRGLPVTHKNFANRGRV